MSLHGGLHSLPPELLLNILLDVVQWHDASVDDEFELRWTYSGGLVTSWHYARVHELSSVCKSWKTLIDAAPQFWTRLSSSLLPRASEQFLRKSGSTPLEILYEFNGQEAVWLRDQFAPHFKRIRRFVLQVSQPERLPPMLLPDLTGNVLETLQIIHKDSLPKCSMQPPTSSLRPAAFAVALPRLRRLLHRGPPITLNWTAISTLTHLNIQNCDPQILNHDDWAPFILRNNPGLVSVALINLQHGRPVSTQPLIPFHLDHLESLTLIRNTTEVTRRILSAIVAPACVRADIDFRDMSDLGDDDAEPDEAHTSLLNWSTDLERLALAVILGSNKTPAYPISGSLDSWGDDGSAWTQSRSQLRFSLSTRYSLDLKVEVPYWRGVAFRVQCFHSDPPAAALQWLARMCNALPGNDIEGDLSFGENRLWEWVDMPPFWDELANVPYVTTLSLDLPTSEEVVAFFLREPPVLPSLSVLSLRLTECTSDFMIPVIRYRNSDAAVTRLKELRITSKTIDREPPEELKELVGVRNLFWHRGGGIG